MSITRRSFLSSAAVSATALASAPLSHAGTPDMTGYIFGTGPAGRCDSAKIGGPIVKWHEQEQRWWMWYYCRDTDWPEDVAPGFGTGRVALAKSANGIDGWERVDGPLAMGAVFEPNSDPDAFDMAHVASGDVLYHDGEWIMAYFGGDSTIPREINGTEVYASYHFKGYRGRPGIARSTDGLNWTRVPGNGVGGASVDIGDYIYGGFPSIIHDGERFLMHYATLSPTILYWETHIAASTNLVDWEPLGQVRWDTAPAVWELGGSVTRHITANPDRDGPRWIITYSGLDARQPLYDRSIGLAYSDDALTWSRGSDQPIILRGPVNAWDGGGVTYSYLVPTDDELRLYYYGFNKSRVAHFKPERGIGLAISAGDPTTFRKYGRA